MKVKIGPYKNWVGPYQIAEKLMFWVDKHEDRRVHELGTWLATNKTGEDSLLTRICQKIDEKRTRCVKIKIDKWDTWSMDHILALIVHPMLVQLKETNNGAPNTDDEDVPEHLRSTSAPAKEHEWDTDANWFARWDWVMDEMIWAHKQLVENEGTTQFFHHEFGENDTVPEGWAWVPGYGKCGGFWVDRLSEKAYEDRINNGLRLFGKYYRGLWD